MPAGAGALPAGTRKVQIDYTALRLTAPRQIRFRYRLDGFDRDWVDAGARRQAYYTNLAPGSYVFRVQANGDDATWTVPEAQWPFTVQPAFRQTSWFYALCGTALLLAAWGAAHTRVLDPEPAVRRDPRRAHAPEPRDSRHDAPEPRRHRAAGAGDRPAVRTGGARSSSRSSSRCGVRSRSTSARRARRFRTCDRPCSKRAAWRARSAEIGRRTVTPPTRFEVSADSIAELPAADRRRSCCASRRKRSPTRRGTPAPHASTSTCTMRRVRFVSASPTTAAGSTSTRMLSAGTGHYGLTGMRERAARIGGRSPITSSASGTLVEAIVPCDARHERDARAPIAPPPGASPSCASTTIGSSAKAFA